jgi:hypothetical protein
MGTHLSAAPLTPVGAGPYRAEISVGFLVSIAAKFPFPSFDCDFGGTNFLVCAASFMDIPPKYDGTDRWLKRVQISKDVSKHLGREYSLDIITDI